MGQTSPTHFVKLATIHIIEKIKQEVYRMAFPISVINPLILRATLTEISLIEFSMIWSKKVHTYAFN